MTTDNTRQARGSVAATDDNDLEHEMMAILKSHGIRLDKLTRFDDAIAAGRCKLINRDKPRQPDNGSSG